jgi:polar amino acid transport system permease protein
MSGWHSFGRDLLEQWPLIFAGLLQTIQLTVLVSVSGLLLGIAVFYCSISSVKVVRIFFRGYVSFFIGMPLIVLLFLMYYGLPQWGIKTSPFVVALVGFSLNVAAYNAAYLSTAYNGLDSVEIEAARAQGFSSLQVFRFLTLPQVLRLSVPALTNQCISNLKDSSVAFLIQYTEFFARVQELAATNFQFFKAYLLAALVYLAIVSVIVLIARRIERRFRLETTVA